MSFWKVTTIVMFAAVGIAGVGCFIYVVLLAQEFSH
jgi:hypothetical protein